MSLNLFKTSKGTENITCPNCLFEQDVDKSALSAFCKNCRTRIDIRTLKQPPKSSAVIWKPKTKTVSCPSCHTLQEVLATALSAWCKNCNQRISVQETIKSDMSEATQVAQQREITCPHCGSHQKVPSTALSGFCNECGNRINMQNYEINSRFRGNLETKGVIYISNDGNVEGNIDTGSIVIAGRFKGEIIAEDKVELKSTAKLYGKIIAPALTATPGAVFVGRLHIGNIRKKD